MALKEYFHKKYFKPLSHFFETQKKTNARTLRTTFKQKFIDTWQMWSGSPCIIAKDRRAKAGLLDYAMLHVPYLIGLIKVGLLHLMQKAIERPSFLLPYFLIFGGPLLAIIILDTAFDLIKQGTGLMLSIVSLPFIAIVQAITYGVAHKDYHEMQEAIPAEIKNPTKISLKKDQNTSQIILSFKSSNHDIIYDIIYNDITAFKKTAFYRFNYGHQDRHHKGAAKQIEQIENRNLNI